MNLVLVQAWRSTRRREGEKEEREVYIKCEGGRVLGICRYEEHEWMVVQETKW